MANKTLDSRLQALEHSLYGNGAIGMKKQREEMRENQKKQMEDFKAFERKLLRLYWIGLGIMSVVMPMVSKLIVKLFMN